MKRTGAHY